jgi:hypothetical protein
MPTPLVLPVGVQRRWYESLRTTFASRRVREFRVVRLPIRSGQGDLNTSLIKGLTAGIVEGMCYEILRPRLVWTSLPTTSECREKGYCVIRGRRSLMPGKPRPGTRGAKPSRAGSARV